MAIDAIDVAFRLDGGAIPADHAWTLYCELAERLSWLEAEQAAGVHPIRGACSSGASGEIHVGGRGRLMLRLPRALAERSFTLCGARLALGGGIEVGTAQLRPLFAHGTLYSPFVSIEADGEAAFLDALDAQLRAAEIRCKVVLGRMRRARLAQAELLGFSAMLHELSPEHSLALQRSGIGAGRKLGCGIFVPHRSAAAVGS